MATEILMPQLGMNMTEGIIIDWVAEDGVRVAQGQPLLEFETDKVTGVIEAPAAGTLQRVAAAKATVPVHKGVGYILAEGEAHVAINAAQGAPSTIAVGPAGTAHSEAPARRVLASPIARRLAAQRGIDLATLSGSGPGGRITEADVQATIQQAETAATPAKRTILQKIPLVGRRKLIAQRMLSSLTSTAQLTLTREVDASELVDFRQCLLDRADELGVRVSYDALFVKALASALSEEPMLNAVIEGDDILVLGEIHVAVAVAAEDGLVVPVVRDAATRSLVDISETIEALSQEARQGRLLPDELADGTVTITNLGAYGVDSFTPILSPPQSAILGIGRVVPRPTVLGSKVVVAPSVHLSLTWDHRVTDGVPAARVLNRLAELINDRRYLAGLM